MPRFIFIIFIVALNISAIFQVATYRPYHFWDVDVRTIQKETGLAYTANLSELLDEEGNLQDITSILGDPARLDGVDVLLNDTVLGPGQILHQDIRELGGGRYSIWGDVLYFSTPDNSAMTSPSSLEVSLRRTQPYPTLWIGLAAFATMMTICLYALKRFNASGTVLAFLKAHKRNVILYVSCIVVATALLSLAIWAPVSSVRGVDKTPSFVMQSLKHSVIGVVITLAMWITGIATFWPILSRQNISFPVASIFGFLVSLPIFGLVAVLMLEVEALSIVAPCILVLCVVYSLITYPLGRENVSFLIQQSAELIPAAILLGCWYAFEMHGPITGLDGAPNGDMTFYAAIMWALELDPWPIQNFGAIGSEYYIPFNQFWTMLGAAFLTPLGLDPHIYLAAAGGSAYVLNVGLSLALLARFAKRNLSLLSLFALICLAIVCTRSPAWVIDSIPVVHVVPVVIACVLLNMHPKLSLPLLISFITLILIGTMFTKVTSFLFAACMCAVPALKAFLRLKRQDQILLLGPAIIFAAYALWLFIDRIDMFASLPFGPDSYQALMSPGRPWSTIWPYVLRDMAYVGCLGLAFRHLRIELALALSVPILAALICPFLFRINGVAALWAIGLLVVFTAQTNRVILSTLSALLLGALPATLSMYSLQGDLWLVWPLAMAWCAIFAAVSYLDDPAEVSSIRESSDVASVLQSQYWLRSWALPCVLMTLALGLALASVGKGYLSVSNKARISASPLTEDVYDIWKAVRLKTETNGLIFTDQVGTEFGLLKSWNAYAGFGQRQVYIANISGTPSLAYYPDIYEPMLATNSAVLAGELRPEDAALVGSYKIFYAVIAADKTVPASWNLIHSNAAHVLYEIS